MNPEQHRQRQVERVQEMTAAIYGTVLASSAHSGDLVGINFPVTMQALFNVVVAIAAIDPSLNNPSNVRKFADIARKILISDIRDRQASPRTARLTAMAIPAAIGPDGELEPAKSEGVLQ